MLRRSATALGLLAVLIGAAMLIACFFQERDLLGNPVIVDPEDRSAMKAQNAIEDIGVRFRVPSRGLDVPVGEVSEIDGQILPPGFRSVYRVRNRGVDLDHAAFGTIYLVTHSARNGAVGPGNYLIDVQTGTASLRPGDQISVGDLDYEVTKTSEVLKGRLSASAGLWANQPKRLVVITCLQRAQGGPSIENVVIEAELQLPN